MKKLLKRIDWMTPVGKWNAGEIVVDIFFISMIFILGTLCSYIYYA